MSLQTLWCSVFQPSLFSNHPWWWCYCQTAPKLEYSYLGWEGLLHKSLQACTNIHERLENKLSWKTEHQSVCRLMKLHQSKHHNKKIATLPPLDVTLPELPFFKTITHPLLRGESKQGGMSGNWIIEETPSLVRLKVAQSRKVFWLWSHCQKKVPNYSPE